MATQSPATRSRAKFEPSVSDAQSDDNDGSASAFVAVKIPFRVIGVLVLLGVALALAAYASWSVDDPSLSYATNKAPQNWLSYPGAMLADFGMQFLGLATLIGLVPPAVWGWGLLQKTTPSKWLLRLLTWLGSAILAAGVMSCFAAPATWPLPTGLGGLTGSAFVALAQTVTGEAPSGAAAILYGLILLPPMLGLLWLATGISSLHTPTGIFGDPTLNAEPEAPTSDFRAPNQHTEDPDAKDHHNSFEIIFGAIMHGALSIKTAWRRARQSLHQRNSELSEQNEQPWRQDAQEPDLNANTLLERREPVVDSAYDNAPPANQAQPFNQPFDQPPTYDDEDYFNGAEAADVATGPSQTTPASEPGEDSVARLSVEKSSRPNAQPRVAAPAAKIKPGQRIAHEAQGSLLADDGFQLPELALLTEPSTTSVAQEHQPDRLEAKARQLEGVLQDFGVKGDIINVRPGPVVTLYELEPAPGIKSSRVISLADDIARSMSAVSARVAVVPGRNAIGIELPNKKRETVYLREMLASSDFEKTKARLPICLGKTIGGEPIIADLARMPHLLIAGTTGSGKSVGINTMILSLLYRMTPEQCRLIMIDPKMLELSIYDGIPHLLSPVVTDPSKAVTALKWAVREMEDRYRKMSNIGVRNIDGFNNRVLEAQRTGKTITRTVQTGFNRETGEAVYESETFELEPLPYIVIIVDEMADLMMVAGKDIEGAIQRLAQMARAAGIHLVTATQRPSVDVITGTIKANFPTRISFQVTSKIDSRTILGEQGAEQLLGMGDMLYMAGGGRIKRLHGPFVGDQEVEDVVKHLKEQATPDYLEIITQEQEDEAAPGSNLGNSGDELYDKAVNIVLNDRKASTSYIQRRLSIGYNRAATLIERLEQEGVISAANHAGKREILVGDGVD